MSYPITTIGELAPAPSVHPALVALGGALVGVAVAWWMMRRH